LLYWTIYSNLEKMAKS